MWLEMQSRNCSTWGGSYRARFLYKSLETADAIHSLFCDFLVFVEIVSYDSSAHTNGNVPPNGEIPGVCIALRFGSEDGFTSLAFYSFDNHVSSPNLFRVYKIVRWFSNIRANISTASSRPAARTNSVDERAESNVSTTPPVKVGT
mgnify:CR=1 FL=1